MFIASIIYRLRGGFDRDWQDPPCDHAEGIKKDGKHRVGTLSSGRSYYKYSYYRPDNYREVKWEEEPEFEDKGALVVKRTYEFPVCRCPVCGERFRGPRFKTGEEEKWKE